MQQTHQQQQQHQQILLLNFNWCSAGVAATAMLHAALAKAKALSKSSLRALLVPSLSDLFSPSFLFVISLFF